jgi:L-alanine-DL-glutamate epimerase-like enolase superfamily enzyme
VPHITEVQAELIEIPLRHVFATAQDKLARQVSRLVRTTLTFSDGATAVGETAAVQYVTGETPDSALADIRSAAASLVGLDASRLRPAVFRLAELLPDSPSARAGIEMALFEAFAARAGLSMHRLFGGSLAEVETDVTLSIAPDAVDRAREAAERGFHRFKVKVGSPDVEDDYRRIIALRDAVPHGLFRVDANQAFTAEGAILFIRRCVDAGVHLEMVEQPVPKEDLSALDHVARRSPVPVIADEAVKTPTDALRVLTETAAHGVNVKVMKSGLSGALDIVAVARAAGKKLMIGCMLESQRGIAASLALACGTGAFDYVDLDSHLLLADEPAEPLFRQAGPIMGFAP